MYVWCIASKDLTGIMDPVIQQHVLPTVKIKRVHKQASVFLINYVQ